MKNASQLLHILRLKQRLPSSELLRQLNVSRATLMRMIRSADPAVITRGQARRVAYATRRPLRGSDDPLRLYCIDETGAGSEVAQIDLTYPQGCAISFAGAFEWPLMGDMRDGWFEGIPYPLDDIRPQGFLGRQFARRYANILHVPENPADWSEDDALYALATLGADQPGNYILGDASYQQFLSNLQTPQHFLDDNEVRNSYEFEAEKAMQAGVPGSSAGGEFPKFTASRRIDGKPHHVIVKFSGSDNSSGSQRWADLLICEHLASRVLREQLGIAAADSRIYQAGGRTFLEVIRFDRHGFHGRSAVCSWSSINAALFGLARRSWADGAAALEQAGLLAPEAVNTIQKIWHFGRLIANTDMHDGNLAFLPGLQVAPVYDMLPMAYAPERGVEVRAREFTPQLPLPSEQASWMEAAQAARFFWQLASSDERISNKFRSVCRENAKKLNKACNSAVLRKIPT
jgi:hypothetical protein